MNVESISSIYAQIDIVSFMITPLIGQTNKQSAHRKKNRPRCITLCDSKQQPSSVNTKSVSVSVTPTRSDHFKGKCIDRAIDCVQKLCPRVFALWRGSLHSPSLLAEWLVRFTGKFVNMIPPRALLRPRPYRDHRKVAPNNTLWEGQKNWIQSNRRTLCLFPKKTDQHIFKSELFEASEALLIDGSIDRLFTIDKCHIVTLGSLWD